MSRLKVGDHASDFKLRDQFNQPHHLSDLLTRQAVVLVFYPLDQSPFCTLQLRSIHKNMARFNDCHVTVLGVNHADDVSHERFSAKKQLAVRLLSDTDYHVSAAYDCLFRIAGFKVIRRTVVGIAQDGTIRYYQRGMPSDHEVLAHIGNCRQPAAPARA
ncbi:MAG TPA: redoxin domain-containing protein [Candidatus Saccharimonadales bacterium]|nr:redoxin domain-containing protein [Candidatus Saccharimonadales bacterium]